jgi:hypothetical protein
MSSGVSLMQWLRRLKAGLSRGQRADAPATAVRASQEQDSQVLSRVQQNLSWLPVYQEPEPFSTPLPGCPPLMSQDTELRNRYLAYVARARQAGPRGLTEVECEAGRLLARDWHSRAIDLASTKATEQYSGIYWYMQCAAIASLFADGVTSEAFIRYRKDVDHYKDWPLANGQVWAFNLFVDSFTPRLQSGDVC